MAKKIPIPQELIDNVRKLYDEGLGQKCISDKLGYSKRVIKNVYKLLKIDPAERLNKPPPTERTCRDCKQTKPIDQFVERAKSTLKSGEKSTRVSYETRCLDCFKKYHNDMARDKRTDRKQPYVAKPHLTQQFLDDVKAIFDSGVVDHNKIAKQLNCKLSTVNTALKKLNLSSKGLPHPKDITPEKQEMLNKVRELFDQGLGQRAIAKKLGCVRETVKSAYDLLGIDASKRTNPRKQIPTEKECCRCKVVKPIDQFRRRYNKQFDRVAYEASCKDCDRIYNNDLAKKRYHERKVDEAFKLRRYLSYYIWKGLKRSKSSKGKDDESCMDYLPYTIDELRIHIEKQFEPWMTWDNWGMYDPKTWNDDDQSTWTWHIDHIVPHSKFIYKDMSCQEFKDCWALSNLRPLAAKQNILDGNRR